MSSEKNLPLTPSPASRRHGVGVRKSRYLCLPEAEVAAHCSASAACMRLCTTALSLLFSSHIHSASCYWLFSFSTCSYCTFNTILYFVQYCLLLLSPSLSLSHTQHTHTHSLPTLSSTFRALLSVYTTYLRSARCSPRFIGSLDWVRKIFVLVEKSAIWFWRENVREPITSESSCRFSTRPGRPWLK